MRDQSQHCNNASIPSAIISSDFDEVSNLQTLQRAINGDFKILFISPERLSNKDWIKNVIHLKINMIVIDEAHCISIWGHDFRPDYRRIGNLLTAMPLKMPVLALTATANKYVEEDILQQVLGAQTIRGQVFRNNLWLTVIRLQGDQEKLAYLATLLPLLDGTGLIYTATRKDAEMVAAFLTTQNFNTVYYHAAIEDALRQNIEQEWMVDAYKVVCATKALGMGVDKADVRFVIHYQMPASPIDYYQEIGRAGRDGQIAKCILLYDPADKAIQEHFIQSSKPKKEKYLLILSSLCLEPLGVHDIMRRTGIPQTTVSNILADLEENGFIGRQRDRKYVYNMPLGEEDFYDREIHIQHKGQMLQDMLEYAGMNKCYMNFLAIYLGDQENDQCGVCGYCQKEHFQYIVPTKRMQQQVTQFMEEDFLPGIAKSGKTLLINPGVLFLIMEKAMLVTLYV